MLLDNSVQLTDPAWGEYSIHVINTYGTGTDHTYKVLNGKGKQVNVEWATVEGATACIELLAAGYLKEQTWGNYTCTRMPSTSTYTGMARSVNGYRSFNQIRRCDDSMGRNITTCICYHMLPNRMTL